jgi:hypothetical protein
MGTALERVLQAAEKEFNRRLEENDPFHRVGVDRALEQARAPAQGPYPDLSFSQRVRFFREISSASGRFRGLLGKPRSFGGDLVDFRIQSRRRMAGWRVRYPERPVPKVPFGPRRRRWLRMRPGSYADIASGVARIAAVLKVPPSEIVAAASESSASRQRVAAGRLLARSGRTGQKRAVPGLLRRIIESLALVRAMEAGRMPGQMAAQALSVSAGGSLDELIGQDPMAVAGSGVAADRDIRGQDNPTINPERVEQASRERRARIARIFNRLRQRVRSGTIMAMDSSRQTALVAVTSAFERLLAAQLRTADEVELARLEGQLVAAVVRFLETFHGGSR